MAPPSLSERPHDALRGWLGLRVRYSPLNLLENQPTGSLPSRTAPAEMAKRASSGVRLFDADRMSEPVRTGALGSDHSASDHDVLSRSVLHLPTATPTAAVRRRAAGPRASRSSSSADEAGDGPGTGTGPVRESGRRRPLSARMQAPRPQVRAVPAAAEAAMRARAEAMVSACLLKSRAAWDGTKQIFDDPKQWKLHYAKTHVAIYRHRGPGGSSPSASASPSAGGPLPPCGPAPTATAQHFVATGRIPGLSLQDVEYGNYADTTPDERAANAYLHRDYFLDAAVLRVVDAQTDEDPFRFFGLKWSACAAPRGHNLFSPRDAAYLEYARSVPVDGGARVLVKVVHSVGEDVVPPLGGAFVRMAMSMSTMYRFDAKTNAVQVFAEGWIDPRGRGSAWLGSAFLSHFVPPVVRIEHCADIKYIMKHGLVFPRRRSKHAADGLDADADARASSRSGMAASVSASALALDQRPSWVPDHQRKVCFVCFKSFGLVRRHRHHCRMCGEVMCARCMLVLPLVAPVPAADGADGAAAGASLTGLQQQPARKELSQLRADGFPAVHAVKLCKKCMFNIRQERKGVMYGLPAGAAGPAPALFAGFQQALGMPSMMLRQFPIVLSGTRAVQPGEGGDEYPYHPFPRGGRAYDPYAAEDDDEDEDEDDEAYARRIEALRRAHLEQEQRKNARASIRLYDADDLRRANGEPTPPPRTPEMNFDDLLLPADKVSAPGASASTPSSANELFRNTLSAADAARRVSVTLLPPSDVSAAPRASARPAAAPIAEAAEPAEPEPTRETRSLSFPDQLERVEKSIAHQGALLQSISKLRASAGGRELQIPAHVVTAAAAAAGRPGRRFDAGDSPVTAPTATSGGSP